MTTYTAMPVSPPVDRTLETMKAMVEAAEAFNQTVTFFMKNGKIIFVHVENN